MDDALFQLLKKFLQKGSFHVNFEELRLQLLSHPSYPSLHSITGVLDHFRIDNLALEVPTDRETLMQLPKVFLTINQNNQFIVVTKLENGLEVISDKNNKTKMSIPEFLDNWKGVVVAIEKDDTNLLKDHASNKGMFKKGIYIALAISVLGLFFYSNPTLFQSTHFVLGLGGLAISFLIVKHELGFRSPAIEKLCGGNETTSCEEVLDSKGAKIFGWFKLSDICLVYFLGLSFAWLFSVMFQGNVAAIIAISLLVVPVTLYSIYYQAVVVKKWCPLCLGIVGILWLQCCSLIWTTPISTIDLDPAGSFVLFFSFMLAASLWIFTSPLLLKEQELEKLTVAHYKFIRNFDLFKAVHNQNEYIETAIWEVGGAEIVLGNPDSPMNIVVVTSPLCFYCKAAHTDLEKIFEQHPDQVKMTIRFNMGIKDKEGHGYRVASRLIEIYNTVSAQQCTQAMHEAYLNEVDFDKWLLKWGEVKSSCSDSVLQAQQSWCLENGISFTPAVYVNGRQFPKEYERSDLSYFVEDLVEEAETHSSSALPTTMELVNE